VLEPVEISRAEGGNPPTVRPRPAAPPTGHEEVGPTPPLGQDQLQLTSTRLSFSKGENGEIIVRVFNESTGDLIRQIPPAERLQMAARIQAILQRLEG
jgi:hypothetical protein